jgi:hypothetical protein
MAYVFYESGLSIDVMYTATTPRSGRSGSSSPKGWKSPRSSPRSSSSRGRSRSWPQPFAVPTSTSKTSTDPRTGSPTQPSPAGRAPDRGLRAAVWRATPGGFEDANTTSSCPRGRRASGCRYARSQKHDQPAVRRYRFGFQALAAILALRSGSLSK